MVIVFGVSLPFSPRDVFDHKIHEGASKGGFRQDSATLILPTWEDSAT